MPSDLVALTVDESANLARITLRRPQAANAVNREMARTICQYLEEVDNNDDVKVVVLSGEGEHFSAGWDAAEVWTQYVEAPGGATGKHPSQRARLIALDELWWGPRGVYSRLLHCRKVTILAAHGHCFETGLYFALCSDLVVASKSARFANPRWQQIGVDGDMSLLIASVGLKRAKQLMFCGDSWTADEAQEYGLVDWAVDESELHAEVERLATMSASIMRDGIVTEKYAVFASLEKMGVGHSFATATVVGASMSNIHFQPGEFNFLREMRDRGVGPALDVALGELSADDHS